MSTDTDMVAGTAHSTPAEYDEMTINGVFDYVRTLVGLPAQVQALTAAMAAANETIQSLTQQVNELRMELADARDTIRAQKDQIEALETNRKQQLNEIVDLNAKLTVMREDRDNAEHTVTTLRGVLIERDNVVSRLQADLAGANQTVDEHKLELATRNDDITYWRTRHANEEERTQQHSATISTQRAEIGRLNDALEIANARQRQLESALGEILAKVNSMIAEPKLVEHQPLALAASDGQTDPNPDTAAIGFVEWPLVAISA